MIRSAIARARRDHRAGRQRLFDNSATSEQVRVYIHTYKQEWARLEQQTRNDMLAGIPAATADNLYL